MSEPVGSSPGKDMPMVLDSSKAGTTHPTSAWTPPPWAKLQQAVELLRSSTDRSVAAHAKLIAGLDRDVVDLRLETRLLVRWIRRHYGAIERLFKVTERRTVALERQAAALTVLAKQGENKPWEEDRWTKLVAGHHRVRRLSQP